MMRLNNLTRLFTQQDWLNRTNKGSNNEAGGCKSKNKGAEYIHSSPILSGIYSKSNIVNNSIKTIQARNSVISFSNGSYYKFADSSGKTHLLMCQHDRLSQPDSVLEAGGYDKETYNIAKFWNLLSHDGTYLGLYYSKDEQRNFINSAGVNEGFFTVATGKRSQEYYYSNGSGIGEVAVRKFEYDATYQMFKRGSALFNKYEVGSVFKIGGKEYVLDESRKFDIPYGDDVFDIQFPQLNT